MKTKRVGGVALLLAVVAAGPAMAAPGFHGFGGTPGLSLPVAADVSSDGSVVVGTTKTGLAPQAFRWTAGQGFGPLGELPPYMGSSATAVSADGQVVVGASGASAFRWTHGTGMAALDHPSASPLPIWLSATGVSADGSVVCGMYDLGVDSIPYAVGFRWTQATGVLALDRLGPYAQWNVFAEAVSADGSAIVGSTNTYTAGEAFLWTVGDGMRGLGYLLRSDTHSAAQGISPDGAVVVGWSGSAEEKGYREAFRWTEAGGLRGLGDLPGGDFRSEAVDVSADGAVVVGVGKSGSGDEAFIWSQANGMRPLHDVLVQDCGLDLTGWRLTGAAAVSDDGLTIVGLGTNPSGQAEAWTATLPEPATLVLVALALAALAPRRRRP